MSELSVVHGVCRVRRFGWSEMRQHIARLQAQGKMINVREVDTGWIKGLQRDFVVSGDRAAVEELVSLTTPDPVVDQGHDLVVAGALLTVFLAVVALLVFISTAQALDSNFGDRNADRNRAQAAASRSRDLMNRTWGAGGSEYRGRCCGPQPRMRALPTQREREVWSMTLGPMSNAGYIEGCDGHCNFSQHGLSGDTVGGWFRDAWDTVRGWFS